MFVQFIVLTVLSTCAIGLADDSALHRFRGHISKINGKFESVVALESAYKEPNHYAENVVATGFWDQTYNVTGWSILEIKTYENQSNADQAYSAGLLEGQLTRGETLSSVVHISR
jgi:hypothetical protein